MRKQENSPDEDFVPRIAIDPGFKWGGAGTTAECSNLAQGDDEGDDEDQTGDDDDIDIDDLENHDIDDDETGDTDDDTQRDTGDENDADPDAKPEDKPDDTAGELTVEEMAERVRKAGREDLLTVAKKEGGEDEDQGPDLYDNQGRPDPDKIARHAAKLGAQRQSLINQIAQQVKTGLPDLPEDAFNRMVANLTSSDSPNEVLEEAFKSGTVLRDVAGQLDLARRAGKVKPAVKTRVPAEHPAGGGQDSVRLSDAEEDKLARFARAAGVSVDEYRKSYQTQVKRERAKSKK